MATLDLEALLAPLSDEAPCGPDLNMTGDTDYLVFRANVEGLLPASYFSFDPKSIDTDEEVSTARALLERSRDLEILMLVERLLALGQDLDGFVSTLDVMVRLLDTFWDTVHPQPVDGDFTLRTVPLTTLDDRPTVVLPLQHLPLLAVERLGRLSYRDHLLAAGELSPREGEVADPDRVRKILQGSELDEIVRVRDRIAAAQGHLTRMRDIFVERAGYEQAVKFTALPNLLTGMEGFLDDAIRERDPAQAGAADDEATDAGEADIVQAAPARPQGAVASHDDARRALATASRYFVRFEPSSASRLLIHQARELMGLSFSEMLATLAPNVASDAVISIPGRRPIRIPLERLGDRLGSEADAIARDHVEEDDGDAAPVGAVSVDGDMPPSEWSGDESADGVGSPDPDTPEARPEARADNAGQAATRYHAATRGEAVALVDAVASWYRSSEPASPIPILLDKARDLASRDFTALLQDMIED